jgi:hypothetical protein
MEALQDFNFGSDSQMLVFDCLYLNREETKEQKRMRTYRLRHALSIDAMEVAAKVWISVDKRNIGQRPNFSRST